MTLATQNPQLDSGAFVSLMNEVLESFKRAPLGAGGPEERVIVVRPEDRVLQILAGPGSGKTEMLVWRVLYELLVIGTASQRVLVTTFTRRAATELQVRLVERCDAALQVARRHHHSLVDPKIHDLRVGTIHSLCDSLLAEFDTTYVERGTEVIDEVESSIRVARDYRLSLGYINPPGPRRVLNRLLDNLALTSLFRPPWDDSLTWPTSTMDRVSCILAILYQHTETWIPRCAAQRRSNGVELVHGPTGLTEDLMKLQTRWEQYLAACHAIDFATIQKRFLESQTLIAPHISHVFVDEFQDNNPIQFALHTGWLRQPDIRLTVVGDDDQAIYRFRGSDIECFNQVRPFCHQNSLAYRLERLETNYRSTRSIVHFAHRFRDGTVLSSLSTTKNVQAPPRAPKGPPVRILTGPWGILCDLVAEELRALGAGMIARLGSPPAPTAAVLMFSSSERSSRRRVAPALALRQAIEARGLRTYNPRSRMAASPESPVAQLLGLISYLIDPITVSPAGAGGRSVMVAASMNDHRKDFALSAPPPFPVSEFHLDFQKRLFKSDGGGIGTPSAARRPLVDLVDRIRDNLVRVSASRTRPRLTLAGFVSRLLSLPYFRASGFTTALFRQALFTTLLEANIAATRLSMNSLDDPFTVAQRNRKYVWPDQFWSLLSVFGSFLDSARLDDPDVESFEEDAVLLLTFHQTKGLEFDHVYVAGTGRSPDVGPALRTKLFSGESPKYTPNPLDTRDKGTLRLALADRDREVYVALTRAKTSLTILHDPTETGAYMALNGALETLFADIRARPYGRHESVKVKEFQTDD